MIILNYHFFYTVTAVLLSYFVAYNFSISFVATLGLLGYIQLFRERFVAKTVQATIPKGNMGYDQYTCSWLTVAVEPTFVAFL